MEEFSIHLFLETTVRSSLTDPENCVTIIIREIIRANSNVSIQKMFLIPMKSSNRVRTGTADCTFGLCNMMEVRISLCGRLRNGFE